MAVDGDYIGNKFYEGISTNADTASEVGEFLTRIELEVAYSSEKVLNLDMLLMHMTSNENDHETLLIENDVTSPDLIIKAFEIDILSGILSSELKDIDHFMKSLQNEITDAHQRISLTSTIDISMEEIEEKLHVAEESLKKSRDHVSEIKMQSAKFERILCPNKQVTYSQASSATGWKMLSMEQQKYTLRMLEKSLARELDLEKNLSDVKHNEEEIRFKLHCAEHEIYCLEEALETFSERLFEAENSSEVLIGISKELAGELHLVQFNLSSSIHRESDMKHRLENSMLQLSSEEIAIRDLSANTVNTVQKVKDLKASLEEAEKKSIAANSEALTLREKVNSLEQQLTESSIQLELKRTSTVPCQEKPNTFNSELSDMENVIKKLKENISKAESRAMNAESRCILLAEANSELNKELGFLKGDGAKKATFLQKKLEESDMQLEQAKASVEAIEQQQNMLYSALSDMEHLIEELKKKVSKAEKRAESADSKHNLLTETNSELNDELAFLKGRLEYMENSLCQSNDAKIAMAKDIGIRTKIITDLVARLAMERKRLQKQISALRKENKILVDKYRKINESSHARSEIENGSKMPKSTEESITEASPASFEVQNSDIVTVKEPSGTLKDEAVTETKPVHVRTIGASQLTLKHVLVVSMILLLLVLTAMAYS